MITFILWLKENAPGIVLWSSIFLDCLVSAAFLVFFGYMIIKAVFSERKDDGV